MRLAKVIMFVALHLTNDARTSLTISPRPAGILPGSLAGVAPVRGAACNDMDWHKRLTYKDGKLYHKARGPEDFKRPGTYVSWNRRFAGKIASSTRQGDGYALAVGATGKQVLAHRIIWEMHNGPIPEGMQIDHINGIRDDNRIENLRLVTHAQNCQNAAKRRDNTSGYKGVGKKRDKWQSRIYVAGKCVALGVFDSLELAAQAYNEASTKHHGEHGRPN